jgi:type II secretory pathway component GspD/PulD (secretin)
VASPTASRSASRRRTPPCPAAGDQCFVHRYFRRTNFGDQCAGANGSLGTGSTGPGFFGLTFQSSNFAALLSFLEGQGDVQVLSSPRIATTNNQKAVLKVGTDDYFVTGVSTNTTTSAAGNVVTPNITLQPFFSGIALDVTPQIDDEGNIILHVHPSVSVVEEKTKNVNLGDMGTFTLPLASAASTRPTASFASRMAASSPSAA